MCEFFLRFCPFGPELWGKRGFFKSGTCHVFYIEAYVRISYMGTFFEAMVLKFCWDFAHSGPNYGEKGVFSKVGLSHFFYFEANVRISYMGTFFEAVVLKLCTGYLVHITECVLNLFAISPIRA